jgi:hypothetical protein
VVSDSSRGRGFINIGNIFIFLVYMYQYSISFVNCQEYVEL